MEQGRTLMWVHAQKPLAAQVEGTPGGPAEQAQGAAHTNAIVDCRTLPRQAGQAACRVSTAGWDGRVCLWEPASGAGEGAATDRISALHL